MSIRPKFTPYPSIHVSKEEIGEGNFKDRREITKRCAKFIDSFDTDHLLGAKDRDSEEFNFIVQRLPYNTCYTWVEEMIISCLSNRGAIEQVCDACNGSGFLLTTKFGKPAPPHDYYIERCDACEKYADDNEAIHAVHEFALNYLKSV